ncbi:MAG TPA: branched-chain amino acid ABC transporter permease [Solirubrobacteraceae bacterium]|jgi:branched-chain amino acid transport system permease protein|nr:branched-chain amino acid ABC transporter permease [Solirubrobacteraceae bacterium]
MTSLRRRLGPPSDWSPALVLLLAAAALPAFVSSEYVLLAASMIVTMLLGVSFNLLFGYAGMFSFGQAAFYGLGAYVTVLVVNNSGVGFYVALLAGVIAAALVAALSGTVLVRLEPIAFIMLTFALADLFEFAANHAHTLTGGDSGMIANLPNSLSVIVGVDRVYYVILGVATVVLAVAFVFVKTDMGLLLRGIREDALRARTLGIAVDRRRLGVFTLAAGVAAAGGGLSVLTAQIVYPSVFAWQVSANALIVTLLGGVGLFSGPALGAVLLGLIDFYVGRLTTNTLLIDGVVLLTVVLIAPRGVGAGGRGGLLAAPVTLLRRVRALARGARAGATG